MRTYPNGEIPLSALTPVKPYGHLLHDAAVAYEAMRQEAAKDNVILRPAGPDLSTYRNVAGQIKERNDWCARGQCDHAAVPGTSNHGLGKAVDFFMGPGVFEWLLKHAAKFGFSHAEGARIGEDWHWVFALPYTPPRDPLWFMTARERRLVRELLSLQALRRPTAAQVKRRKSVWRWLNGQKKLIQSTAKGEGGWDSARSKAAHRQSRYNALRKVLGG